jgi:L-malate glycosyltransferase
MRVLHILPSMQGYGAERQIMLLLPELHQTMSVGLVTIYTPSSEQRAGVTFPVEDAARNGRRDFTFIRRLVARISAFEPDIVHTHTHVGKYWGRFAAAAAGVRTIVHTEHNPCDPRRSFLDRFGDRALDSHTTRYVTFFPEQCGKLAQIDGVRIEKIDVIPNGLAFGAIANPDRARGRELLGVPNDQGAILLVGRMEYQKNHELALRAFAAMTEAERRATVLFFAGSGDFEVGLRGLAASLGISDRVRFLGFRNDVAYLLAGADLLLMTSRFEGMPLTLLEAMHAGVPILTTPWIGSQTMLGDGKYGCIASAFDPSVVAREIAKAFAHRDSMQQIADRARQYVRTEFSLQRMAEAHRALYHKLSLGEYRAA